MRLLTADSWRYSDMKRFPAVLAAALFFAPLFAQTPIVGPDYGTPTRVAPEYFGPNAFPVPEMSDGKVKGRVYAELAGDYYNGSAADGNDHTCDVFIRLHVPLGERADLEVFGPMIEHWSYSPAVAAYRRITTSDSKSWDSGDAYIGTNLQFIKGRPNSLKPDLLVRAVLKTAMGNTFDQARYYDAAGYYFDATFAWSRCFLESSYVREIRGGLSGGFLCWQDGLARQNDAVQYGLMAKMDARHFLFTADFSGYSGWEKDGDCPVRLRLRADGRIGAWRPFVQYVHGLRDYPFDGVRLGIAAEL